MDGTEEPALASGASVDELVPGSVVGILGLADATTSLGDGLYDSATALSRVEVTGWYGAASTAAHDRLGQEPGRWVAASGAFIDAGEALRRYAAALAPARARAEQAVDAYRRYLALVDVLEVATSVRSTGGATPAPGSGQVATSVPDRAQLGHRAAVLLAAAHGEDAQLAYDADALRRQAISLLAEARSQALAAGDVAADSVQAAMADAPQARTFWQGTIRRPGAEDAGHASLDVVSFVPGWVGMAATALNVGWYALEGDRENAGYAAMGFVPLGMGKVGKEIAAGSTFFRFGSKADLLKAEAEDLPGFAKAMGLTPTNAGVDVFESSSGLRWEAALGRDYVETHRLTHVLAHCFPADASKSGAHSIFAQTPEGLMRMIDQVWSTAPSHMPGKPDVYVVDMGRPIGIGGERHLKLVVAHRADGDYIITAHPLP